MNVAVMKTKAEQAVIEQFDSVVDSLPGTGWMPAARRAALGVFAAHGLPHRRIEEWKYTDLRVLLKAVPRPAAAPKVAVTEAVVAKLLGPEFEALECFRMVFVNGTFMSSSGKAPEGVHIGPLTEYLGASDWMEARFGPSPNDASNSVMALNTAFVTDGALFRIDDGTAVEKPIHVVHVVVGLEPASVTVRNLIEVGAGAKATIIESYVGPDGVAHLTNAVTEIEVGDGAEVVHVKNLAAGSDVAHIGTWTVTLGANVTYRGFQSSSGTKTARNQIFATYAGQHTKLDLSGIFLARGNEHLDTTLVVDHAVPNCESRELFKGVLDGHGRGIFQGKIIVRPDAQKTDGKQMAQVLMLSPDAEFDSKPELEIYADDVVCGHGATAAELDDDLIFYCRARGIPLAEARALLTESFIGEAIEKVENDALRDAFMGTARRWLALTPGA